MSLDNYRRFVWIFNSEYEIISYIPFVPESPPVSATENRSCCMQFLKNSIHKIQYIQNLFENTELVEVQTTKYKHFNLERCDYISHYHHHKKSNLHNKLPELRLLPVASIYKSEPVDPSLLFLIIFFFFVSREISKNPSESICSSAIWIGFANVTCGANRLILVVQQIHEQEHTHM